MKKQIFRVWAHPYNGGDDYAYDFDNLREAIIFSKTKSNEERRERALIASGKSLLSSESRVSNKDYKEAMKHNISSDDPLGMKNIVGGYK